MNFPLDDPELQRQLFQMYREFFDKAEKKRRWSLRDDIPWDQCNPSLDPVVADVVETFCSVEMYLPDYMSSLLGQDRSGRGRTWFLFAWGYEESKHSLALEDWLLKSRQRTEGQMADMQHELFKKTWKLPYESPIGMICYTMMQELATFLHYRNLQRVVKEKGGDPALDKILTLISVDERAHHDFFKRVVQLALQHNRAATLELIRDVVNTFQMPAWLLFDNGPQQAARIRNLHIFDEEIYFFEVCQPYLSSLGLTRQDLRQPRNKRTPALA